jgi:ABC-type uncharacterized transport system permease subunit
VLQRGGVPVDAFTQLVSKDIVQILQALVILFVAAEAMFRRSGGRRQGGGGRSGPVTAVVGADLQVGPSAGGKI